MKYLQQQQQLQTRVKELEQENQKLKLKLGESKRLNQLCGTAKEEMVVHHAVVLSHQPLDCAQSDDSSPKSLSPRSSLSSGRSRSQSSSAQSINEAEFDIPVLQLSAPDFSNSNSSVDGSDELMSPVSPLPRPDTPVLEALPVYLGRVRYGHNEPTDVELSPLFIEGVDSVTRARELLNIRENQAVLGDRDTVVVYSKRMDQHYTITKGVDGIWSQANTHRRSCAPELDWRHLDRVTLLES